MNTAQESQLHSGFLFMIEFLEINLVRFLRRALEQGNASKSGFFFSNCDKK
jgi:hypothetical protein